MGKPHGPSLHAAWPLWGWHTPTSWAKGFSAKDEAVKLMPFAAELCLKSFVCLYQLWGDYSFRMSNVVSMNQAGVSVEGDVTDNSGYYLRQTFLDMNLGECRRAPEARCTAVKVVVINAQWNQVFSKNSQCILLGAKVVDWRLLMNYADVAFQNARVNSKVPEDAYPLVGHLFAGFGGPLPWRLFQIVMACTGTYTSEIIALSVPCPAWFLVDAAHRPLSLRSDVCCRSAPFWSSVF